MGRQRPRIGDVFSIPLDEDRFAVGQVVADYLGALYCAVYAPAFSRDTELDLAAVLRETPALLALSLDAKIYHGHWTIITNARVADDMPFPAYKVMNGDLRYEVEDYTGKQRRPASPQEVDCLSYRNFVAPVIVEKGIRARHGLEPWHEAYAELEPSPETTTARMFESS